MEAPCFHFATNEHGDEPPTFRIENERRRKHPSACASFGKCLSFGVRKRARASEGLYTHPLAKARSKNISSSCHSFEKKRAHAGVMYVVLEQSHIKRLDLILKQANMDLSYMHFERGHVACISQFADFFDPKLEERLKSSERARDKNMPEH
jgi:hypothetical protein